MARSFVWLWIVLGLFWVVPGWLWMVPGLLFKQLGYHSLCGLCYTFISILHEKLITNDLLKIIIYHCR